MKTLHFAVTIGAPRALVWEQLLGEEGYRDWTSAFTAGSYFEGSWEKGARIRFLSPEGGGMVAEIAENRPREFVSIRHLGFISGGIDDTESESVRAWAPAYENYTLSGEGGTCEVAVDVQTLPEFEEYMNGAFPKALARLKARCEALASA